LAQLHTTADKRCGRLRFTLAVLGLRWRRASSERIVCAAVLDTFFSSLGYERRKKRRLSAPLCETFRKKLEELAIVASHFFGFFYLCIYFAFRFSLFFECQCFRKKKTNDLF
jgi:hypothetical protein